MGGKQPITIKRDKRVLLIEDQSARIVWFQQKLRGVHLDVATTPGEAVGILQLRKEEGTPYDIVFLDHDAVPVFIQPGDPQTHLKTFFSAAQELARQQFRGTVIIHSFNVPGSIKMQFLLGRTASVIRLPFGVFDLEVV
jgi:hypothetical protein